MIKSLIILTLVIGFLTLNSGFVRAQEASTKESLKTALQKIAGQKAIIEQIDQFTQVKEKRHPNRPKNLPKIKLLKLTRLWK